MNILGEPKVAHKAYVRELMHLVLERYVSGVIRTLIHNHTLAAAL